MSRHSSRSFISRGLCLQNAVAQSRASKDGSGQSGRSCGSAFACSRSKSAWSPFKITGYVITSSARRIGKGERGLCEPTRALLRGNSHPLCAGWNATCRLPRIAPCHALYIAWRKYPLCSRSQPGRNPASPQDHETPAICSRTCDPCLANLQGRCRWHTAPPSRRQIRHFSF